LDSIRENEPLVDCTLDWHQRHRVPWQMTRWVVLRCIVGRGEIQNTAREITLQNNAPTLVSTHPTSALCSQYLHSQSHLVVWVEIQHSLRWRHWWNHDGGLAVVSIQDGLHGPFHCRPPPIPTSPLDRNMKLDSLPLSPLTMFDVNLFEL
jgi:hypothetical protein